MKLFKLLSGARWSAAVIAVLLAGVFSATASATVSSLTLNDTARLSPGMLHATLTGTITCDPGDLSPFSALSGQITQSKGTSGNGSGAPVCDGTSQPFSIDVSSSGIFGASGPFKAGKASAQVSTSSCDSFTWVCSTRYTDAVIRLVK
jgi:hypothetical protein